MGTLIYPDPISLFGVYKKVLFSTVRVFVEVGVALCSCTHEFIFEQKLNLNEMQFQNFECATEQTQANGATTVCVTTLSITTLTIIDTEHK